jgi:hypothetical protein|tara:strand:+ start:3134 stop:3355 length:222 start_codon:yes stop_codon:yes gene_type:complete
MKGEEEFFPKGSVWYCDQCKSVGNVEIEVWIDPTTMEILQQNTAVPGGYEGWCHICDDEVVVRREVNDGVEKD